MTIKAKLLLAVISLVMLSAQSLAQNPERRPAERRAATPAPQTQEPSSPLPLNANTFEIVANELGLLRKSLQTLNARLREVSDKLLAPGGGAQSDSPKEQQSRIAMSLELLSKAEQRAEILRKQLLELTEKEMAARSRLVQIEEEMRPESIERATSLVGSTRTMEIRDVRRRVLDNERKGYESLLNQTAQSRLRLDDDVRQADAMVARLRQRLFPLIEKEIDKLAPAQ